MSYRAAKISFDGSHYIATPKENFPQGHKRRRATRPLTDEETEKKAESFISSLAEEDLSMGDYVIKEDKNIKKGADYILYDVCLTVSRQTGVEKEFVPEENENIRGELD